MITLVKIYFDLELALTIAYITLLIALIYKLDFFEIQGLSRKSLSALFLLKIGAGIVVFLVYSYYYTDRKTADIFKYFDDGEIIFNVLDTNPLDYVRLVFGLYVDPLEFKQHLDNTSFWFKPYDITLYNDSRTIIRLNAIIRIFSFGYYQVHNVIFNFISFIGLTCLFKVFSAKFPKLKKELIVVIFCIPSVLFWGSGVLKEAVVLFAVGVIVYLFFSGINQGFSAKKTVGLSLAILLLGLSKTYIVGLILPVLIGYFWVFKTKSKNPILKYAMVLIACVTVVYCIGYIFPDRSPLHILANKQADFIRHADHLNSGSKIELDVLDPTLYSFIQNSPNAIFRTLFRPHIFESHSTLQLIGSLENAVLILIMITSLFYMDPSKLNTNFVVFCLIFSFGLFVLVGLITPVMGAMVRYRAPGLIFLIIGLLGITNMNKLYDRIKSLLNLN